MEKIKVIQVTQAIGGVETYLRHVLQNIDHSKFEIIVVSSELNIEKLCAEYNIKHYRVKMSRGFNPLVDMQSLLALRKIFKTEKPAVVHLHSSKAGFLGRIAAKTSKYKSLFTPHGGSYMSFTGITRMTFFMMEIIGKKFTNKLLAISHSEAFRFMYEVGIPQKNIYIIPNALAVSYIPAMVPDKLGLLPGKYKIGTIGRLTYQKNPLLFIDIADEVIKQNPDAHFFFLGVGFHDHLKKEVDEKIKQYGIAGNLHLIGKGDHATALSFLRQLDIFILPSIYEGLSYALLEAMFEAVPCVVSKCPGNYDIINNNENGFACITHKEFAEMILHLLDSPLKAKTIGEAGKKYVAEKHNIKRAMQLLQDVYTEIAAS